MSQNWVSGTGLYTAGGAYVGAANTLSQSGEWLQLTLPEPFKPASMHMVSNALAFSLFGSNDNATWTQLPATASGAVNYNISTSST